MTKFSIICSALGTACCGTAVVATYYPEAFGLSGNTPTVAAEDHSSNSSVEGASNTNKDNSGDCNECKDASKCVRSSLEDSMP